MSPDAKTAWSAYLAMAESKRSYFTFLHEINEKYKAGGTPAIAETLKLEQLLKQHNSRVKLFAESMALVTEQQDREVLLAKMQQNAETANLH